jgi:SulP family sulfate permease
MPRRRLQRLGALTARSFESFPRPKIFDALRKSLADGYGAKDLRSDLLAGMVVGIVALPLSMALSIAVGAPPERGLYTAMIAGFVTALTGGSRFQVTGPTAAFIVILAPIVAQHGLGGLLVAGFLAGAIMVAMGMLRLGRLIEFIPHPVTTGFTAGIAVVIGTLQLKDVFGLTLSHSPESYVEKVAAFWHARHTMQWPELAVASATLALLLIFPRITKRVPAPLLAIGVVTVGAALLQRWVPSFHVRTIPAIPRLPPHPSVPWTGELTFATVRAVLPSAFAIAMLGAIESLLSAVIADGMTGSRHDPDGELIGQGLGNLVTPFFGGIPATGALARTATNIRAGGRSAFSAIAHSAFVLLAIVLAAPALAYVPMASLAALLLLVAWNMSEVKHFKHILEVAPKSDVAVLVSCFLLTVFFDMVIAVSAGVVLAALLFMRRMAELTEARLLSGDQVQLDKKLPKGVVLYEIAGPLFFGAAARAIRALEITGSVRVVIIHLGRVPAIDATGLVALEIALKKLKDDHAHVILSGPLPEPRRVFDKANLDADGDVVIAADIDAAIAEATAYVAAHRRHEHHGDESPPPSSRLRVASTGRA